MYKSFVKKKLKKNKKSVDFEKKIWYIIVAATKKQLWSLKTKQNVNFE